MSIRTSLQAGVATIEIDRPDKKNALTAQMYQAMADALHQVQADPAVRAILFAGQPGMFTAGNDLEDFVQRPPKDMDAPVFRFMQALVAIDKPVIAAVEGVAVGIGVTMLLHCDLVYVADNAKLALPFVNLGVVAEFASSFLLPLNAGYVKAAEKLLLGEPFTAQEALEMRIVNAVLPAGEVLPRARASAEKFARLPPGAVRDTKKLLRKHHAAQVAAAIQGEGELFCARLGSGEAQEAMTAFLEKRKPDFSRFQ
jgi:enoyl-CoA hydratase/carnithine racemase